MLIIYTSHITNRFKYIIETLCKIEGIEAFQITDDVTLYKGALLPSINYSDAPLKVNEIWIKPFGLLMETNIYPQTINCFEWKKLKVFFKTEGTIPFDIFSASFYLITRYEEYLSQQLDNYGRYAHTNSLAYKEDFLHQPLIELWLKEFITELVSKSFRFSIKKKTFQFQPTYDIDIAFAYADKNVLQNIIRAGWYVLKAEFSKAKERIEAMRKQQKDPHDVYTWLNGLHETYNLHPVYFFLLADKRKGYDKNTSPYSPLLQQLIKAHAEKYTIGIHPSWQSGDNDQLLHDEISLLSRFINKPLHHSRQHYIRMKMPDTYRKILNEGILYEYSMGYGSINGFRASVSSSFYWYDLLKDEQTKLLVHPFCYMDANAYFEQHLSAEEAAKEMQYYHDIIKSLNGKLSIIMHNHFLTEDKQWIEWRKIYEDFLQKNFADGNFSGIRHF